jgi:hypothetical protein
MPYYTPASEVLQTENHGSGGQASGGRRFMQQAEALGRQRMPMRG